MDEIWNGGWKGRFQQSMFIVCDKNITHLHHIILSITLPGLLYVVPALIVLQYTLY